MSRRRIAIGVVAIAAVVGAAVVTAVVPRLGSSAIDLGAGYHAVLLTNGQAYFGKLEKLGSRYPVLTDVYYVQNRVDPQTKAVSNVLVKRGSEWHAPDRMILNAEHILFVEPVGPASPVAKLIEELRRKP